MPIIHDSEFGKITIRRSAKASQIRVSVAPDGNLRASMPLYAPIFLVKRLIKSSRDELHHMITQSRPIQKYTNGMLIGKSHTLIIHNTEIGRPKAWRYGQHIMVNLPPGTTIDHPELSQELREVIISSLRLEAKSYLPKRLAFLAKKMGFHYERVRFSHASGRWGSCSTNGTISLNIALMKLPFELIDYVIIHELAHTQQMNHSHEFWNLVGRGDPDYRLHRHDLKTETPSI
jgi:predicted metal-dependent hydrolase